MENSFYVRILRITTSKNFDVISNTIDLTTAALTGTLQELKKPNSKLIFINSTLQLFIIENLIITPK